MCNRKHFEWYKDILRIVEEEISKFKDIAGRNNKKLNREKKIKIDSMN